jgi:hypothetical protein
MKRTYKAPNYLRKRNEKEKNLIMDLFLRAGDIFKSLG